MPHLLSHGPGLEGRLCIPSKEGWRKHSEHGEQCAPRTRNTEAGAARERESGSPFNYSQGCRRRREERQKMRLERWAVAEWGRVLHAVLRILDC